jgi:hypothetical protein
MRHKLNFPRELHIHMKPVMALRGQIQGQVYRMKGRIVDFGRRMRHKEGLEVVGRIVTLWKLVLKVEEDKNIGYDKKERSDALEEA